MKATFRTKDTSLAAVLRHLLGPQTHVDTVFDGSGTGLFVFEQRANCLSISRRFYASGEGEDGIPATLAIDDARALLGESRNVFAALVEARQAWIRKNEENNR